ncbi:MAG: hypothetical protein K6G52_08425 [Treponemataceae bacterium]|nr:hypothetical protein [Treponemataceae bacterium]
MNKTWGIIGAICFALSVAIGFFFDFKGDTLVQIGLGAFGFTALVIGAVKEQKAKDKFGWHTIVCIVLASISGCLFCVGGIEKNMFTLIAGAVTTLLSIILGIVSVKVIEKK